MNKLVVAAVLSSLFASAAVQANDAADLKCTLESGDVLTLSHSESTVYIEFLGVDDDPDEGGSVIKLDVPSGGAVQTLGKGSAGSPLFALRGTDSDIEGAVAVVYEQRDGKPSAYFSLMNSLGKEVQSHTCKPATIQAQPTLLTTGIAILGAHTQNAQAPVTANRATPTAAATLPVKINVDERLFQYGSVRTPYRTVNITSVAEGLVVNGVVVNRNQCSAKLGNPNKPFELPFGRTVTFEYNIQHRRCDVVEIVVQTNQGDWTFTP